MIVLSVSACPVSLKGDLSRWLFEVDTGVFVGRVSARVREHIWERVVSDCKSGHAVLVYATRSEQGFDFRLHNCRRDKVDLDGLMFVRERIAHSKDVRCSANPADLIGQDNTCCTFVASNGSSLDCLVWKDETECRF